MHSHFCTENHKRISHIIAGISHIYQLHPFCSAQMLLNGKQICQHLCWVIFISQAIPYRYPCIFCQRFHLFLAIATILNSIINSSKHSCSIFDTLFFSNLRTLWVQISSTHSKVMSSGFKGTSGSGTGFFKNQGNILST